MSPVARGPGVDVPQLPPDALARARALMAGGGRRLLGLAGPPGTGKSTLAALLAAALGPAACVVPMDGFHLAQRELERLGRAGRKGAPDTFDAAGYRALLQRLRAEGGDEAVYAPEFRREIEEPVAGAIAVAPEVRLVITEGNYLLLDEGPWAGVAALLDEAWYVDTPDTLRVPRLVARHVAHGRAEAEARRWVGASDEPNARRVASTRGRAAYVFRWAG